MDGEELCPWRAAAARTEECGDGLTGRQEDNGVDKK
jgi:hypothetical protein